MKTVLLFLLRVYKFAISPMLGQNCRFYPSCSDYAAEAIRLHGAGAGGWLALRRLCKCHPWHPGGLDFVPGTDENSQSAPTSCQCACQSGHTHSPEPGHAGHSSPLS